ncbi:aldo/keto reductase [Rhodoflexus sp.]
MQFKLFGKTGLRVSELCLGTMTFGTEWNTGADYETSKKIFDTYANTGGNFIDTANRYTEGTSEKWLSEFVAADRDYFVIASKYTLFDERNNPNANGNHRKNMMRSVEGSLKRLNTGFLDIFWVHMWDFTTSPEEVMRGLDDLVRQGKVHYVGISDAPAWVVAQCNTLADFRGWTSFAGLQIEYSLIQRSAERDLLPMAKHFGMAVTPWAPLGAGMLTGKYNQGIPTDQAVRLSEKSIKLNDRNRAIAQKVCDVAAEIGATPSQVALAWLRQQGDNIIPILGARRLEQIRDSLGCLRVHLSEEHLAVLNEVSQIELGFPHDFLQLPTVKDAIFADTKDKIIFRK